MRGVIQDMLRLYPSTIAFINLCFNIVVRSVTVTISFAILLVISIPSYWLINYVLDIVNAPYAVKERLSLLGIVVPLMMGVAIVLRGIIDTWNITKAELTIPDDHRHTESENED